MDEERTQSIHEKAQLRSEEVSLPASEAKRGADKREVMEEIGWKKMKVTGLVAGLTKMCK